MSDIFSAEKRSEIMARVKSRHTKPELAVRSFLHHAGYRFRLHRKDLPGSPDIVLSRYRIVVQVQGCFWHQHYGCKKAKLPVANAEFWELKLDKNKKRDVLNKVELKKLGWKVIEIWQCDLTQGMQDLLRSLVQERKK